MSSFTLLMLEFKRKKGEEHSGATLRTLWSNRKQQRGVTQVDLTCTKPSRADLLSDVKFFVRDVPLSERDGSLPDGSPGVRRVVHRVLAVQPIGSTR